jgi:hypothetical protein
MRLKKIGVISDIHLRESMPYAECVADRREAFKESRNAPVQQPL